MKYQNIRSLELRKRLIESDKKVAQEMREWWEKILPRKGSVLRQLVDTEFNPPEITLTAPLAQSTRDN